MDMEQLSTASGLLQGLAVIGTVLISVALIVLQWITRTIKKTAMRDIGLAFNETIQGLSSPDIEVRMAYAVLLRRFFDKNTELGVGGTPFANDAINSISAVLRESRTSKFQKVLADGLRFAPPGMLRKADFQGVNLSKASLGGTSLDFSGADFFQANLSGATLRGAIANDAVFVEAVLASTSLKDAQLARADFRRAMIDSVSFDGATLTGARFAGATLRNVTFPANHGANLEGSIVQQAHDPGSTPPLTVFISRPSLLNRAQEQQLESVCKILSRSGCMFEQLLPAHYDQTSVLSNLTKRIRKCQGLVAFGFSSMHIAQGSFRPSTEQSSTIQDVKLATAWNHVEAGMAIMLKMPVLLLSESGVSEGVFDPCVNDPLIFRSTIEDCLNTNNNVLQVWLTEARK